MIHLPNFEIESTSKISQEFLHRNISTFQAAAVFMQNLKYGRNANKDDLSTLFADNCGTCSTKHAVLKQLADENGFTGIRLMLGIFKMSTANTPKVGRTLAGYNLAYIPEAHNYLRYQDQILDFTRPGSKPSDFINDLLHEIEIHPADISHRKVELHKAYLKNWLAESAGINLSLEEIWDIREQCIQSLSV
jgi:hypothetical protein